MTEHPPERVAAAMAALAEAFSRQYGVEAVPHVPGRKLPPGARHLPALSPEHAQAVRDRRTARRRRENVDVVDE
jgi:hypothetical protein